jgi:uncharacterized protein
MLKPNCTIQDMKDSGYLLLEAVCGSTSYGLATSTSDVDIHGVYVVPPWERVRVFEPAQFITSEKNDHVYWEMSKFLGMLGNANPMALEFLYSPSFTVKDDRALELLRAGDKFITKKCASSFAQYAQQQIKKAYGLNKKVFSPQPEKRLGVLDFCFFHDEGKTLLAKEWLSRYKYEQSYCALVALDHMPNMYAMYYQDPRFIKGYQGDHEGVTVQALGDDERFAYGLVRDEEKSMDIHLASVPKGEEVRGVMAFNRDAYTKHCKEHASYWEWVKNRNDVRYEGTVSHGKGYDAKNMMHVFRLLHVARDIAQGRGVVVDRSFEREFLLDIKAGKYSYDYLMEESTKILVEVVDSFDNSSLPYEFTGDLDSLLKELTVVKYGYLK